MNFDVTARTILRVRHGSQAYGTNTPTSDLDIKGVCIQPLSHMIGFLNQFEQHTREAAKGHENDEVIYALRKFVSLAADCNPNIIEVLHVREQDVMFMDEFGEELRSHRDAFLSRKAKFTFSGYAHAQLNRIKTHRAWLLNPPAKEPERSDFGLSDVTKVSKSELGAFDSLLGLKTVDDDALANPEEQTEVICGLANEAGILLPRDVITLFTREKAYQAALTHYKQYLNWLATRNKGRADLEARFGYDTKHGMHLLRLMRMCLEILLTGKVNVYRDDREELLDVRYGRRPYDDLIAEAEDLKAKCDVAYEHSILPKESDRVFLDRLTVDMTLRYYKRHNA